MKQTLTGKFNSEGNIEFAEKLTHKLLQEEYGDKDFEVTIDKIRNKRTTRQNNALHLYFQLLAKELNQAGLDMRKMLKPGIDIEWSTLTIKEYLWKPIQKAMLKKRSTTELNKDEVDKVFETLNRFLGEKHGVHVEFPSEPNPIYN